jgi:hypothetical protein
MKLAKILGTLLIAHSRSMQIPSPFVSPLLALAAFAPLAVAQEDAKKSNPPSDFKSLPAHRQIGFDSINTAHCRSWLTYLAATASAGSTLHTTSARGSRSSPCWVMGCASSRRHSSRAEARRPRWSVLRGGEGARQRPLFKRAR